VTSATGEGDLPDAGAPEISMVGRSNVGKSTLINALVRTRVARTSATPGKTRLINLYRVVADVTGPFFLVDLPGFGYARGPKGDKQVFDRMAAAYFARADVRSRDWGATDAPTDPAQGPTGTPIAVLLLADARHPGMEHDLATCAWLRDGGFDPLVVVTKIDKLSRRERAASLDRFGELFASPALAVSATTGEGLEDLWKRIVPWIVSRAPNRRRPRR